MAYRPRSESGYLADCKINCPNARGLSPTVSVMISLFFFVSITLTVLLPQLATSATLFISS